MSKKTPVVALAFYSTNPVPGRRRTESKARAQRFGEPRNLGESRLVAKDAFGYIVEANVPVQFMSAAALAGARVIPFTEFSAPGKAGGYPGNPEGHGPTQPEMTSGGTPGKAGGYPGQVTPHGKTDPQGIEGSQSKAKASDDGRSYSSHAKSKVKAGSYGATDSKSKARGLKEGIWVSIPSKMEATRIEMSGTQPIGRPTRGKIHEGYYYILGIQEATDGSVITLGKVDKLSAIGSKKEGQYLYNVDGDTLAQLLGGKMEGSDPSMTDCDSGGVLATARKQVKARKTTDRGKKKEDVTGAVAGATVYSQRESQVTTESAHSRGLKLLTGVLKGMGKAPKTAMGQQLLAENKGNASQPIPKATPAPMAKTGGQNAALLEAMVSGNTGGPLTGGAFDQALDPNLESQLAIFRTGMQAGAQQIHHAGVTDQTVTEAQIQDHLGVPSVDPRIYAERQQLAQILSEDGIDINELSDEEIAELLTQLHAESEDDESEDSDYESEEEDGKEEDTEDEPHGELFEDLLPGDVQKFGSMAGLLKQRGYANADVIASKLEAGEAAETWFNLTGGSLQDAKRLQWLYVRSSKKGHF